MSMLQLQAIETKRAPSVTEQVFEELYQRVISLELPPGAKLSEVEVARHMGVSRQPVRDAFYRLSRLGLLTIRPQRATIVAPISERDVLQARFIRTAIEQETVQVAARQSRRAATPAPANARPAPGGSGGGRRQAALPRSGRRVPPPDLRVDRSLIRLDGDQGAQGAYGPGPLSEPGLRSAQRARTTTRRSWRRCRRTIRQGRPKPCACTCRASLRSSPRSARSGTSTSPTTTTEPAAPAFRAGANH